MRTVCRELREAITGDKAHQVDRAAGVIRRVKVLGKTSPNRHGLAVQGTEYSSAAMQRALPLYEGRQVYIDHPSRSNPAAERSLRDLVGVLRGATVEADGIYADLHYPPKSIEGNRVADLAESIPESFGMSHNAKGSGSVVKGKYVVESIDSVNSVDTVTRPATTRGLYESREPAMAKTLKEALGAIKLDAKVVARLLEIDGMDGDAPPPAPADVGGGDESAETHLGRSILAIVNDESLDAAAKRKKILAILKLMDNEESSETSTETEGGDDEPTMESIQAELQQLKRKDAVLCLCESEKFTPSAILLKSLMLLEFDADRKLLIGELKAAKPAPKPGVRSQGLSRTITESAETPKDNKSWLSRLKAR